MENASEVDLSSHDATTPPDSRTGKGAIRSDGRLGEHKVTLLQTGERSIAALPSRPRERRPYVEC